MASRSRSKSSRSKFVTRRFHKVYEDDDVERWGYEKVRKNVPKIEFKGVQPIEIPAYEGYVYIYYYDPGDDMDHYDFYYIRIKPDEIAIKLLKPDEVEKLGLNAFNTPKPWGIEAFKKIDEIVHRIMNKQCPFCGRRMKVVYVKEEHRTNESYGILRSRYPDVLPYDRTEEFWFTCFRCGIRAGVWFDTVDGGAGWSYKVWIEVPEKGRAEYYRRGYYANEERWFDASTEFLIGLHKLGLIKVVER